MTDRPTSTKPRTPGAEQDGLSSTYSSTFPQQGESELTAKAREVLAGQFWLAWQRHPGDVVSIDSALDSDRGWGLAHSVTGPGKCDNWNGGVDGTAVALCGVRIPDIADTLAWDFDSARKRCTRCLRKELHAIDCCLDEDCVCESKTAAAIVHPDAAPEWLQLRLMYRGLVRPRRGGGYEHTDLGREVARLLSEVQSDSDEPRSYYGGEPEGSR